jgi:hypothetical protein
MDELKVSDIFQQRKRAKKSREEDLCTYHGAHRGHKGVYIYAIKSISMGMVA